MNLALYGVLLLLLSLSFSCTSDTNNNSSNGIGSSHALDTTVGYCYQIHNDVLEEALEIQIKQNKLTGQGSRIYMKSQKIYSLRFEGVLDGNQAEVTIYANDPRKEGIPPITHREDWTLSEKQLLIERRNIDDQQGQFTCPRTRCQMYTNKDSTLFDLLGSYEEGYAVVGREGYYGLMKEDGTMTIPMQYRDLGNVSEGMLSFFDNKLGLYGLLDVNGKILVEPTYVELMPFGEGLAAFMTEEGQWGFLNTDLETVIPAQYKGVYHYKGDPTRTAFHEGLANVQLENDRWSFINKKGDLVILGDFIYADPFEEGRARVFKDNKWYYINKAGECVENCD
ncbi:MAG: WG repeat-containing protein [Aureispira sp.]